MTFTKQERHAQYATPMPLCKRHSHQLRPPLHHHHSKRSLLTTSTLRDITVFSLRTDRLSGWTEVYSTPKRSTAAGAQGLISCFRRLFATFGVPEEISSDGGPEFTAKDTKDFLENGKFITGYLRHTSLSQTAGLKSPSSPRNDY